MPCEICGAVVSNLAVHQRSQACQNFAHINGNFRFQCRKCGVFLEKMGQIRSHVCGTIWVDPRLKEYEIRVATLEKLLRDFSKRSSPSSVVTDDLSSDNSSVKSAQEIENEITTTLHQEQEKSSQLALFAQKSSFEPEYENKNMDLKSRILGLIGLLSRGERKSVDGEDRFYILGSLLGEYLDLAIGKVPDKTISELVTQFSRIEKELSIIEIWEQFDSGFIDSCCKPEYKYYFYALLQKYEYVTSFEFNFPFLNSCFDGSILEMFSLRWWCTPISAFIAQVVTSKLKPVSLLIKNKEGYPLVYIKDKNDWTVDPLGWKLTEGLVNILTNNALELFRKIYKSVYTNNNYIEGWMSNKDLKSLIPMYRNIEIALKFFDLNHLLRTEIERKSVHLEHHSSIKDDVKIPLEILDFYQLYSSRVHYGIAPILEAHPLEIIFDNVPETVLNSYSQKYKQELSLSSGLYKTYPKFQRQVSAEKNL